MHDHQSRRIAGHSALAALASVLAVACKFPPPPDLEELDAAVACAPDTVVCDKSTNVYTACSSEGIADVQFRCSLGCDVGSERCVELDPMNGVATYLDMTRTLPASLEITFSGSSTFNTADGAVLDGATSIDVPNMLLVSGPRVFMFKSLRIPAGATLKAIAPEPTGGHPAAVFVVDGDVVIGGLLDVSADGSVPGPGGGSSSVPEGRTCEGKALITSAQIAAGGGGAGGTHAGAAGGRAGTGAAGALPGIAPGATSTPLKGGCAGGDVREPFGYSLGGAGGGALQIVSRSRIVLEQSGRIDASGGGGRNATSINTSSVGGGGGGSGGAVVLEAPQVVLDGPEVVISTQGGGGGAAGSGAMPSQGSDGGTDPTGGAGGVTAGEASGGAGGRVGLAPVPGSDATGTGDGGGGGGGMGKVHVRTAAGQLNPQHGAAIHSMLLVERLATRRAP